MLLYINNINMLLRNEISKITTSWREILLKLLDECPELEKNYQLCDSLQTCPKKENIFRCFNYFNANDTRVIILGQDPYHGPEQAIGLSFGVKDEIKKPPSLRNIFKKLENPQTTTTLEHWAKQGVLMLNTALTVRQKAPASHLKWWLPFTKKIIEYLSTGEQRMIFVAWGAFAYNLLKDIGEKHYLIVSSHPSPLSYSRKYGIFPSFKESEPFKEINSNLIKGINW